MTDAEIAGDYSTASWMGNTYIIVNNTVSGWYNGSGTGNPAFSSLGTLTSLSIGGEAQTYGDGSPEDHTVEMLYRVYASGGSAPAWSGPLDLTFVDYSGANGNPKYRTGGSTTELTAVDISTLAAGTYNLQVLFRQQTGASTYEPDDDLDGRSHTATFTVAATLSRTPANLDGFSTVAGTASAAQSFSVTATHLNDDLTVAAPEGYEVSKTSGTTGFGDSVTLQRDGNNKVTAQTVYVRLKSTASAGTYNRNVTVSGGGTTQVTVALTGTVTAAVPEIDVESSHAFGAMTAGQSKTETVTVYNRGTGALSISGVTFSGTGNGYCSVSPTTATVAAGGSQNLSVTFAPTVSGSYSVTMNIANDDSDENPKAVTLTATVKPAAPTLTLTAKTASSISGTVGCASGATVTVKRYTTSAAAESGTESGDTGLVCRETAGSASFTFTDDNGGSGLTGCTTYYYKAWQTQNGQTSDASPVRNDKTPLAVPSVSASATSGGEPASVTVTWTDVSGATSYLVQVATNDQFTAATPGGWTSVTNASCASAVPENFTTSGYTAQDGSTRRLGSGSQTGSLISPATTPSGLLGHRVRVVVYAKYYSSDGSDMEVTVANASSWESGGTTWTIDLTGSLDYYTNYVTIGSSQTTAQFTFSSLAKSKRVNISSIEFLVEGTGTPGSIVSEGTVGPGVESYATGSGEVGVGTNCWYRVQAISSECESDWGTGASPVTPAATPLPVMEVSASGTLALGSVNVGGTPATATFTVRNTGTAVLHATNTITAGGAAGFSVSPAEFSLAAKVGDTVASQTVTVTFDPTSTGSKTGTLTITSNDEETSGSATLSLTGTGTAPGIRLEYPSGTTLASGGTVDFGSCPVYAGAVTKTITVVNTGTGPLTLTAPMVTADQGFEINPALGSLTVAAGGSTTFGVKFTPASGHEDSTKSATVTLENDAGADYTFTVEASVPYPSLSTTIPDGAPTGMSTPAGTPGTPKRVMVSGENLRANVRVQFTTGTGDDASGLEMCLTEDGTYTAGPLTITANGTLAATPVYVRLKGSAAVGNYAATLQFDSTPVAHVKTTRRVSGSVTALADGLEFAGAWWVENGEWVNTGTTIRDMEFGSGDYYYTPARAWTHGTTYQFKEVWRQNGNTTWFGTGQTLYINGSGDMREENGNSANNTVVAHTTEDGYYTLRGRKTSSGVKYVAMFTENAPVEFASENPVVDDHATAGTGPVTVTATLAGAKSTSEHVYLRYSTDGGSSYTLVEMQPVSGSTTQYTNQIPATAKGTSVQYYVLTSPHAYVLNTTDTHAVDLCTLRGKRDTEGNFTYTTTLLPPTGCTVTPGYEKATLAWALNGAGSDVMVVRYAEANPSITGPQDGTEYKTGDLPAIGDGGVVVYKAYNGTGVANYSLSQGTAYTYVFYSVEGSGSSSKYSAGVQVGTTTLGFGTPAVSSVTDAGVVTLSGANTSRGEIYVVSRITGTSGSFSGNPSGTLPETGTSLCGGTVVYTGTTTGFDDDVIGCNTYKYKVWLKAADENAWSAGSGVATQTMDEPGAVTVTDEDSDDDSITLEWDPADRAGGYMLSVWTGGGTSTNTDTMDESFTGVTGTGYADWSGKTGASGAVWAGKSANNASYGDIQLNNTSPYGIWTTGSGGKARKVTVDWAGSVNAHVLEIYGKATAYASEDLYSSSSATKGTLLGSITNSSGCATSVTIEGDYAFIGLRSKSGALYFDSIEVEWETGGGLVYVSGYGAEGANLGNVLTAEVDGLSSGTTYSYSLWAIGNDATCAGTPATGTVTTGGTQTPGAPGLSATTLGPASIKVTVSAGSPAPGGTGSGYLVYRFTDGAAATNATTVAQAVSAGATLVSGGLVVAGDTTDSGLVGCTTYYYKAWARSVSGGNTADSAASSVAFQTTDTTGTPGGLSATANAHGADLSWSAAPGATDYEVDVWHTESGAGWGEETWVGYSNKTASTVLTEGTAPTGSSATFLSSGGAIRYMEAGDTMTLTLHGWEGYRITGVALSVSAEAENAGAGLFTMTCGESTISSIPDSSFASENWYGTWESEYMVWVYPEVTTTVVGAGEDVTVFLQASENNLWYDECVIYYEPPADSLRIYDVTNGVPVAGSGIGFTHEAGAVAATVTNLTPGLDYGWSVTATAACEGGTATGAFSTPELVARPVISSPLTSGRESLSGSVGSIDAAATDVVLKRYETQEEALAGTPDGSDGTPVSLPASGTTRAFSETAANGLGGCHEYWYRAWQRMTVGSTPTWSNGSVPVSGRTDLAELTGSTGGGGNQLVVAWTPIDGAVRYVVEVSTDSSFEPGGSETNLVQEFDGSASGWTLNGTDGYYASSSGFAYGGTGNALKFKTDQGYALSPTFTATGSGSSAATLSLYGRANGQSGQFVVSGLVSSVWTALNTNNLDNTLRNFTTALPAGTTQIKILFVRSGGVNCGLDHVVVSKSGSTGLLSREIVTTSPWQTTTTVPDASAAYHCRVTAWSTLDETGCQSQWTTDSGRTADVPWIAVEPNPSPARFDFGTVERGASATNYFTVKNTGSKALTINPVAGVCSRGGCYVASPATHNLGAGGRTQIKVVFTPSDGGGTYDGVLRFTCNAYNAEPANTEKSGNTGTFEVPLTGFCHDPSTEPPTVYALEVTDAAGSKNTVADHSLALGTTVEAQQELPGAQPVELKVWAWQWNGMDPSLDTAKNCWSLKNPSGTTVLANQAFASASEQVYAANGKTCTVYTASIPKQGLGNAPTGTWTVVFKGTSLGPDGTSTGALSVTTDGSFTPPDRGWLLDDFTRSGRMATSAGALGNGWTAVCTSNSTIGAAAIHDGTLEFHGPHGESTGKSGSVGVVRDMSDWGYENEPESMRSQVSWGFHFRTKQKTGSSNGGLFVLGATSANWLGSSPDASGFAVELAEDQVRLIRFTGGLKANAGTKTVLKPAASGAPHAWTAGTSGKTVAVRVDFEPSREASGSGETAVEAQPARLRLYVQPVDGMGGNPLLECGASSYVCEVPISAGVNDKLRYGGIVWHHGTAQLGEKSGGDFDDLHYPCEDRQEIPMAFEVVDEDEAVPTFEEFKMRVPPASGQTAAWVGMENAISAPDAAARGLAVTGLVCDASGIWTTGGAAGTGPAWALYVDADDDGEWGDAVAYGSLSDTSHGGTLAIDPAASGATNAAAFSLSIDRSKFNSAWVGAFAQLVLEASDRDRDHADDGLRGNKSWEFVFSPGTPVAPSWATVEADGAELAVLRWASAGASQYLVVSSTNRIGPHDKPEQGLSGTLTTATDLGSRWTPVYVGSGAVSYRAESTTSDPVDADWCGCEVRVKPESNYWFAVYAVNYESSSGNFFSEPTLPTDWTWHATNGISIVQHWATTGDTATGVPTAPATVSFDNSAPMTAGLYEPGEGVDSFAYVNPLTDPRDKNPAESSKTTLFGSGRPAGGAGWSTNDPAGWTGDTDKWRIHDGSLLPGNTHIPTAGNKLFWEDTEYNGQAKLTRYFAEANTGGKFFVAAMLNYQWGDTGKWVNFSFVDDSGNDLVSFGKQGGSLGNNAAIRTDSTSPFGYHELAGSSPKTLTPGEGNDYIVVGEIDRTDGQKMFRMWVFDAGTIAGNTAIPQTEEAALAAVRADWSWATDAPSWNGTVAGVRLCAGSTDAANTALGHVYFDEVRFATTWEELFLFNDPIVNDFKFVEPNGRQNGTDDDGNPVWQISDGALAHGRVPLTATFDLFHRTGISSATFSIMNTNRAVLMQTAGMAVGNDFATGTEASPVGMTAVNAGRTGRSHWELNATGVALPTDWIALDSNYVVNVHLTTPGGRESDVTSSTASGGTATDELFFGEFGENGSFVNYLEIYNGTGSGRDLRDYWIAQIGYGGSSIPSAETIKADFDAFGWKGTASRFGEISSDKNKGGKVLYLDGATVKTNASAWSTAADLPDGYYLPDGRTVCVVEPRWNDDAEGRRFVKALLENNCLVIQMPQKSMQVSGNDPQFLLYKEGATSASELSDCEWLDMAGVALQNGNYIQYRLDSVAVVPRRYPDTIDLSEWDVRQWADSDMSEENNFADMLTTAGVYDQVNLGRGGDMTFTVFDDDTTPPILGTTGAGMKLAAGDSSFLERTAGADDMVAAGWSFTNAALADALAPWEGSAVRDGQLTCSAKLETVDRLVRLGSGHGVSYQYFNSVQQRQMGTLYFSCNDEGYKIESADSVWIGFDSTMPPMTERGVSFWYATGTNGFKEFSVQYSTDGENWITPADWKWSFGTDESTGGPTTFTEFSKSLEGLEPAIPADVPHLWFRVWMGNRKAGGGSFRMDNIQIHGIPKVVTVTDHDLVDKTPVFTTPVADTGSGLVNDSAAFHFGPLDTGLMTRSSSAAVTVEGVAYTNFVWTAPTLDTDKVQQLFQSSQDGASHLRVNVKDADDDRVDGEGANIDQSELDGHLGLLIVNDDDEDEPIVKMDNFKPRPGGVFGEWLPAVKQGLLPWPATTHATGIDAGGLEAYSPTAGNVTYPHAELYSGSEPAFSGTWSGWQSGWHGNNKQWRVRLATTGPTADDPDAPDGATTFTITKVSFRSSVNHVGAPSSCTLQVVTGLNADGSGGHIEDITGATKTLPSSGTEWTAETIGLWRTIEYTGLSIPLAGNSTNEIRLVGTGCSVGTAHWNIHGLKIEGTHVTKGGESSSVTYITDNALARSRVTGESLGTLRGKAWDATSGIDPTVDSTTPANGGAYYTLSDAQGRSIGSGPLLFSGDGGALGATGEAAGAFTAPLAGISAAYGQIALNDYIGTVQVWDADADRTTNNLAANVDRLGTGGEFGFAVVDQDVKAPNAPSAFEVNGVDLTVSGAQVAWTNDPDFRVTFAVAEDQEPTSEEMAANGWVEDVQDKMAGIGEYRVGTTDSYAAAAAVPVAVTNGGAVANGGFEDAFATDERFGWVRSGEAGDTQIKVEASSPVPAEGQYCLYVKNGTVGTTGSPAAQYGLSQMIAFVNTNNAVPRVGGAIRYRQNAASATPRVLFEALKITETETNVVSVAYRILPTDGEAGGLGWREYTFDYEEDSSETAAGDFAGGVIGVKNGATCTAADAVNGVRITLYTGNAISYFDDVRIGVKLGSETRGSLLLKATKETQGRINRYMFAADADNDRADDRMHSATPGVFQTAFDSTKPTVVHFISHVGGVDNEVDDPTTQFHLTWNVNGAVGPDDPSDTENYNAIPVAHAAGAKSVLSPWDTYEVWYRTLDLNSFPSGLSAADTVTYVYTNFVEAAGDDSFQSDDPGVAAVWKCVTTHSTVEDTSVPVAQRNYNALGSVGSGATQEATIFDLDYDQEYVVVIRGRDQAGNVGPVDNSSWATNNTIKFSLTQGVVRAVSGINALIPSGGDSRLTPIAVGADTPPQAATLYWYAAGQHFDADAGGRVGPVTREYDLIYRDDDSFTEDGTETGWTLAGTAVKTNWNYQVEGITNLSRENLRFYRASYGGRWNPPDGGRPLASEEVYAMNRVPLVEGINYVALHGVPWTNTLAGVFGTDTSMFPAGVEAGGADCTRVEFFDPAAAGLVAREKFYFVAAANSPQGRWANESMQDVTDTLQADPQFFSRGFQIVVPHLDDLPAFQQFTNEHYNGSSTKLASKPGNWHYGFWWYPILQVPTNGPNASITNSGIVSPANGFSVAIRASGKRSVAREPNPRYTIVSLNMPVAAHPRDMNLVQLDKNGKHVGFQPGNGATYGDLIYIYDNEAGGVRDKDIIFYDATATAGTDPWKLWPAGGQPSGVPDGYFKPGDAIVIVALGDTHCAEADYNPNGDGEGWIWTYAPSQFYDLPTRWMGHE